MARGDAGVRGWLSSEKKEVRIPWRFVLNCIKNPLSLAEARRRARGIQLSEIFLSDAG